MPYGKLTSPEQVEKMDSCIAQVMADGKDKSAAIAICYSSISGKSVLPIITDFKIQPAVKVIADQALVLPACNYEGCVSGAKWQIQAADHRLHYCDKHIEGACRTLNRHKIEFDVAGCKAQWVTIEGRPILVGGPGAGGGNSASGIEVVGELNGNPVYKGKKIPNDVINSHDSIILIGKDGEILSHKTGDLTAHYQVADIGGWDSTKYDNSTRLVQSFGSIQTQPHRMGELFIGGYTDEDVFNALKTISRRLIGAGYSKEYPLNYSGNEYPLGMWAGVKSNGIKLYSSVILALKPPPEIAQGMAVQDGLPPEELHITLCYLGDAADLENQKELILGITRQLAKTAAPLQMSFNGIGRFVGDEEEAITIVPSCPELPAFRQAIARTLERLSIGGGNVHGFNPHLTLAYVEPGQQVDVPISTEQVPFNDLWVMWGDEQYSFPMVGEGLKGGELIGATLAPPHTEHTTQQVAIKAVPVSERAQAISDRTGRDDVDAELLEQSFFIPWQQSTGNTPDSEILQAIAARTFGLSMDDKLKEIKINWDLLYPMGEMYNITQEYFAEKGFSEWETIPVYHPYVPTAAAPKQWSKGDQVRIKLAPLTSWTTNIREAVQFADFLGSQGSPAFVLKTFIPVKSIVSTPETGIGMEGTGEMVLAGGEYEALVEAVFQ